MSKVNLTFPALTDEQVKEMMKELEVAVEAQQELDLQRTMLPNMGGCKCPHCFCHKY